MYDGKYATHDLWIGCKKVAQRERHTEHPLSNRSFGQNLINQMSSAISHSPCATGRTETTPLATERYELLVMARFTLHSQKTVLKSTALHLFLEFPDNITGQAPARRRQHVLEQGPVFFYQLIKQRVLWLMSLVLKWANGKSSWNALDGKVESHYVVVTNSLTPQRPPQYPHSRYK